MKDYIKGMCYVVLFYVCLIVVIFGACAIIPLITIIFGVRQ